MLEREGIVEFFEKIREPEQVSGVKSLHHSKNFSVPLFSLMMYTSDKNSGIRTISTYTRDICSASLFSENSGC